MPKWKQGDTFNPASIPTDNPQVETHAAEPVAEAPKKERKGPLKNVDPRALWLVGIVLGIILLLVVVIGGTAWQRWAESRTMNTPGTTPSADIVDGPGGLDEFWSQFDPVFNYTAEEKATLRAWGYTGTEIEEYQMAEVPVAELVEASRQAQEEMRATLANPESPEYQRLLNQTWLGEKATTPPNFVVNQTQYSSTTVTLNADYEKVPVHGTNLFIKVELADGTHHWMECSPFRYGDLADSGNIVVTYDLITFDGVQYITNMREKVVE